LIAALPALILYVIIVYKQFLFDYNEGVLDGSESILDERIMFNLADSQKHLLGNIISLAIVCLSLNAWLKSKLSNLDIAIRTAVIFLPLLITTYWGYTYMILAPLGLGMLAMGNTVLVIVLYFVANALEPIREVE
jgi:hypothetical protein